MKSSWLAMTLATALIVGSTGCSSSNSAPPPPHLVISALAPTVVTEGGNGFVLTVTGSNFASNSTILWNGSARTTTLVDSSTLTAQIKASDIANPGKATLQVSNGGSGAVSNSLPFTILTPIVYESNTFPPSGLVPNNNINNIWVTQGTAAVGLTNFANVDSSHPVWSPDGTRIAFTSDRNGRGTDIPTFTENIWVMNADGSSVTPLSSLVGGEGSLFVAWSPDGSKLAFVSDRALDGSDAVNLNNVENIWVMNADGSSPHPLTAFTSFAFLTNMSVSNPAWSPDGAKVAFFSAGALDGSDGVNANHVENIWVVNADGTGKTDLTGLTVASSTDPAWSPDGSKIAFASNRALDGSDTVLNSRGSNIWVMNADGTGTMHLTGLTMIGTGSPAWSPDGSKLAFGSSQSLDGSDTSLNFGASNIWVMNASGAGAIPLAGLTKAGSFVPVWSPDGTQIVFQSNRALDGSDSSVSLQSASNLWVVSANGTGAAPLSKLVGTIQEMTLYAAFPRWLP